MSGRRRRGRRGQWDPAREGSGPVDQRRFGVDAPGHTHLGTGPRRPDDRGRFSNGTPGMSQGPRRWDPNRPPPRAGGGPRASGNGQAQGRWARGGRPERPQRPTQAPQRVAAPAVPPGNAIDPFELFCAYHLGITANGGYHIQNIHEVARRFGTNAAALRQTLAAYGMDAEDLVHGGFDLASAQIDIMVAPEGISRRELARPLYEEFKSAPRRARDWAREMEEADREIERTIGSEGRWSPSPRRP